MFKFIKKLFGTKYDKDKSLYQPIVELVHEAEEHLANLSHDDLRNRNNRLKTLLTLASTKAI